MSRATRSEIIQRLVGRRDFLYQRNGSRFDNSEAQALEWILLQYTTLELQHGVDVEWKDKILKIVPIDFYQQREDFRKEQKRLKRLNSILRKIEQKTPLTETEQKIYADSINNETLPD